MDTPIHRKIIEFKRFQRYVLREFKRLLGIQGRLPKS